jgi:hypothetical protein
VTIIYLIIKRDKAHFRAAYHSLLLCYAQVSQLGNRSDLISPPEA